MHLFQGRYLDRSHPLAHDCALWWDFSDGCGDRLTDKSGLGCHGVLTNMDPASDWVPGPLGACLDFDGINDRATAPSYSPGWTAGGATLMVLLTVRTFVTASSWLSTYNGATRNYLLSVGATARPAFYSGPSDYVQTASAIAAGSRLSVVGVASGLQSSIYINGALAAGPTAKPVSYGLDQWRLADYGFDGTIEFAAAWRRGLRESEIRDLHSRLATGQLDDLYEPVTPLVFDVWRRTALIPAAARAVSAT